MVILVVAAIGVLFLIWSPPALAIELTPVPPISVKQGGNFSIEISVRNDAGFFKAEAEHVQGELKLPEGFIEESLQTGTRQLLFGSISTGDASHYSLTIIALGTVEVGEYHAKLAVWGANTPTRESEIEITVLAP
jgi:hypothetical protein